MDRAELDDQARRDAGFAIARLREPRPDAAAIARRPERPERHDASRMPYVLIFDARPIG